VVEKAGPDINIKYSAIGIKGYPKDIHISFLTR
jgi:hypothetical protein